MKEFPNFICEACTVRTALDRELLCQPTDIALLMLERMRLIDVVHAWSKGTHKQYQVRLNQLRKFEGTFGIQVLKETHLDAPPSSTAIAIMWAQQRYAIQPTQWRSTVSTSTETVNVKYSTVRSLRSAAAQYYRLDLQMAYPQRALIDAAAHTIVTDGCSPTDELSYTLMSSGMSRRLGDESRPAVALLDRHIRFLDSSLERRFHAVHEPRIRIELARAGVANLMAWLAWLRAQELFGMRWCDLTLTSPADSAVLDFPVGIGAVQLRLLEQTKTEQSRTADLVLAYTTGSGLQLGRWIRRLRSLVAQEQAGIPMEADESTVFTHHDGRPWDSLFFRTNYLVPSLKDQREGGDPTLFKYDGSPGMSLAENFWSMHAYRSGGRSHVAQRRDGCTRKATPEEIREHGRWRKKRSTMDMPTAYLQGRLYNRLALTLLCM